MNVSTSTMPPETVVIVAPDCTPDESNTKPSPISLVGDLPGLNLPVDEFFSRTASYAKDPVAYLKGLLGPDVFSQREAMLCLPDKVDKDMYGSGSHMQHFEQHIAKLLGKDHALFFITGIQAQLAALKYHCDQTSGNNRCAWHITSHLESAELDSYKHLYGLERLLIGRPGRNPSLEEVQRVLELPKDERPAVVVLELPCRPLGCQIIDWTELEKISKACRSAGVKLHCDGARIW